MKENKVVYDFISFSEQVSGKEWIQALEACTLQYISYDDWQGIVPCFPTFDFNCARLIDECCRMESFRIQVARKQNPWQRYLFILIRYPGYLSRVPDNYITSWLEVSESTLTQFKKWAEQIATRKYKII